MYVARCDMEYMREHKVLALRKKYKDKFGEPFISFNYIDFPRQGEKCSAQVYKETLEKALEGDKPYHIVSHRFDFIDH